jgi:hypothetical protein
LTELDEVGFAVIQGPDGDFRVRPALVRKRSFDGEILAPEATPRLLRKATVYVSLRETFDQFGALLRLEFLLNHYRQIAKTDRIQPETVFQRFFEENPEMIYRGIHGMHWAKPTLPLPESKGSYQPDFVLRPQIGWAEHSGWEIDDVKLPDAQLLTKRHFHHNLTAALLRGLIKLNDYRRYFDRDDVQDHLLRRFGFVPRTPCAALVVGRRPDAESLLRMNQTINSFEWKVSVVTYDDLFDHQVRRLRLESKLAP